jgi:carboxyl-terminal processing protease
MLRFLAMLLVLILPGLALAEKKEKKPAYFGVMIGKGKEEGSIVVLSTFDDSPARKAGLKTGDLLLKINDVKPANLETAVKVIKALEPGKKVKILIRRDGKEMTLDITPEPIG